VAKGPFLGRRRAPRLATERSKSLTIGPLAHAPAAREAPNCLKRRPISRWHDIRREGGIEIVLTVPGGIVKVLSALLVLVAIVVGCVLLIPIVGLALAVSIPLGALFIWLLPILIIATSDKTTGGEKLAWILAIIFLSWFAWIFYFLLAPIKERDDYRRYRYY
jgi:hypothetical protein